MRPEVCIYHGGCADGFGAAYAVWLRFPECEFVPAGYGDAPPDVTGRNVLLVDFSYKAPVLRDAAMAARSLLVLDHHKTAQEDLQFLPKVLEGKPDGADPWEHFITSVGEGCAARGLPHAGAVFHMDKSGARLAWEFFHPGERVPQLLQHIEDRDLWRFSLPFTREIFSALMSHPMDFDTWHALVQTCQDLSGWTAMHKEGAAIERKHLKDVRDLLRQTMRTMVIGGVAVPVANMPYTMASDAAGIMAEHAPFAAVYYDGPKGRHFSLRSRGEHGMDVSEVAKLYGGGGHRNAAGFTRPIGWEGDLSA